MVRTAISLPEDLLERARIVAAERQTSMANLVREALEEMMARYRPRPGSIGAGASGHSDTVRRTAGERAETGPLR